MELLDFLQDLGDGRIGGNDFEGPGKIA